MVKLYIKFQRGRLKYVPFAAMNTRYETRRDETTVAKKQT